MRLLIYKISRKLISWTSIVLLLLYTILTTKVNDVSLFDNVDQMMTYEIIGTSYVTSIYMLMVAYVNKLCVYNYIASIGLLFTSVFNTAMWYIGPSKIEYADYCQQFNISVMIPTAMMAVLALIFNTPIEKWLVKYMDNKNPKQNDA